MLSLGYHVSEFVADVGMWWCLPCEAYYGPENDYRCPFCGVKRVPVKKQCSAKVSLFR